MRARLVGVAALALLASCARGGAGGAGTPRPPKPELSLTASATNGFVPLTIVLVGRLSGVADDDHAFDDPGEKWIERYMDLDSVSERQPGKGKLQESTGKRLFYERTVTLGEEGYHSFRVSLTSSDGREVYSNWVRVKALSRD